MPSSRRPSPTTSPPFWRSSARTARTSSPPATRSGTRTTWRSSPKKARAEDGSVLRRRGPQAGDPASSATTTGRCPCRIVADGREVALRREGGPPGDPGPAHRRQRARRHRAPARLRRGAEGIRHGAARRQRRSPIRAEVAELRRQAGRPVLVEGGRHAGRPHRRRGRQGPRGRLHQQDRPVQRLLLPRPDGPGTGGAPGRAQLHRQRGDDRRLRRHRLAGRLRRDRGPDVHGQQRRRRVPEGPRRRHGKDRPPPSRHSTRTRAGPSRTTRSRRAKAP